MYDFIIVGSGLGGLQCAYVLSKEGYKVCVVEKHHQLGGCLQDFKRNNCIFDTGMHYVGSMDEGQLMWSLFKYFDLLGKVKLKRLDGDCFDLLSIAGKEYKYAQGYDNFKNTLIEAFPHEEKAVGDFVNMLQEVRKATDSFLRKTTADIDSLPTMKYFERNAYDYIKSLTTNEHLRQVLSGTNSLHFNASDKASLYMHMVINNSLVESAWRFAEGGNQMADALASSIERFGGTILTRTKVERFIMNDNDTAVKCVELENGERIEGKVFISNIHPAVTLQMVDSKLIRKAYTNRINSIEQTLGIFSVYIVFKENTFKYMNYNYYHCDYEHTWVADIYDKVKWPAGYMLYTPVSRKSEIFADSMTIMTYMSYDDVKKWEHTYIEKRGSDYKAFKAERAELLIDMVAQKFPGIRSHIKAYYTSTPLTYRDYTGTLNGSCYGIMKDSNNALKTMIAPRTRIPNLHLTGQNINLHGVLGVTIGSFITLSSFIGSDYLKNKILDV